MLRKLLLVATLAVAALATAAVVSASRQAVAKTTVATVSTSDIRAVVLAAKSGSGKGPTVAVSVSTYERTGGTWRHVADGRLAGSFFWDTVTGPHAVCRLELAGAGSAKASQAHVTVRLLVSPSIGCGRAQTFAIPGS